jgi:hypothetical protein
MMQLLFIPLLFSAGKGPNPQGLKPWSATFSSWGISTRVQHSSEALMDNWTFGITMMVCGMGGTILTLWIMSLVMSLLGKLFPYKKEAE